MPAYKQDIAVQKYKNIHQIGETKFIEGKNQNDKTHYSRKHFQYPGKIIMRINSGKD
jgi:hypothetical protein